MTDLTPAMSDQMDVVPDGREVHIRLRDDVWQIGEPGTLTLSRKQAHTLRLHLNAWAYQAQLADMEEDG